MKDTHSPFFRKWGELVVRWRFGVLAAIAGLVVVAVRGRRVVGFHHTATAVTAVAGHGAPRGNRPREEASSCGALVPPVASGLAAA